MSRVGEPRRSTVADVARIAGVSASTVSRALSGRGYVAAGVRARIEKAVEAAEYVPDFNARNLRAGARSDVGVVISDLRNPFYAELAAGIEQRLRAAGLSMFLVNTDGDAEQEMAAVRTFAALRLPGVIVTPVSKDGVGELARHRIAVVQADRMVADVVTNTVTSDNVLTGQLATDHLLQAGHRCIALIIDEATWTTGAGRMAGYRKALKKAGIPYDRHLVLTTGLHTEPGRTGIRQLLSGRPDVTAAVLGNNLVAEAVFGELSAARIRVPGRLALVAIDDVPWMSMVTPTVTAVAQFPEEIGRRSAELLIAQIPGRVSGGDQVDGAATPAVLVKIPPTLIVRRSSVRRSLPKTVTENGSSGRLGHQTVR